MRDILQIIAIPLFLSGFALIPWPPHWLAGCVMGIAMFIGLISFLFKKL